MFTVCPKCTLTLAVTAADLRIGQGYVRCGRCLNVFNALLTLSEEPAPASSAPPQHLAADPASNPQVTAALSASGGAAAPSPEPPAQVSPADGPPKQLATESSSDGSIENESSLADGTGTFETIVLEGEAITQTEEFVPGESVDSEIAALTQRLGSAANEPIGIPLEWQSAAHEEPAAEATDESTEAALALGGITTKTPQRRWPWITGSVLLVVLLALQAINHWRDALAASPTFNAPITRIYASMNVTLDPHWSLAAYDVRQQGAEADPNDGHVIHVRMSVANRAARAQPVPLLRLTLLDRYGKHLGERDLTAAEYWPKGRAPRAFLARDERIDSQVAVRDPDAASSSFELDVCLKNLRGVVQCAGDLAPTTAAATP